jgi:SAM-dependent methyltransferase
MIGNDSTGRSPAQIREQYEIEKELAARLRGASREERRVLYSAVYDELFRRVRHHPQLFKKRAAGLRSEETAYKMEVLAPFLRPGSVFLEIGAGDCALSVEVARHVRHVYAVDVSAEVMSGVVAPPNMDLVISDGSSIPVPPESVDLAFSNQLMEHLHPEDAMDQLRAIHASLQPGGLYLCVTPNRISGPHDISRAFDRVATGFHLHEYTVAELGRLMRKSGFSSVQVYLRTKSRSWLLPTSALVSLESAMDALPASVSRVIAGRPFMKQLLGVRVLARK